MKASALRLRFSQSLASPAAVEPGDGAFDHPTPGLDDEALHPIGSLDDLGLEIGQDAGQGAVKDRPLIGAVGEQFPAEQGRQQRETAVPASPVMLAPQPWLSSSLGSRTR